MIEIVPASVRHIGPLSRNMRAIDRAEAAVFGHTAKDSLRLGLRTSMNPLTALVDGQPACMFGVASVDLLARHGRPWLLGTDAVADNGLALCVGARRFLTGAKTLFAVLDNWVAAENHAAIRWLVALGFQLGETRMIRDLAMCHFEWRKPNV